MTPVYTDSIMPGSRWSLSLVAVIGVTAALIAGATIWLLLTDPVTGADVMQKAVKQGDVAPLVQALGAAMNVGHDTSLELLKLDQDINRMPSGDIRKMLRKALLEIRGALDVGGAGARGGATS